MMKVRTSCRFLKTAEVGLEIDKRKQEKFIFFSCSSSPYSLNSCYHRNQFLCRSIENFFHFDGDVSG